MLGVGVTKVGDGSGDTCMVGAKVGDELGDTCMVGVGVTKGGDGSGDTCMVGAKAGDELGETCMIGVGRSVTRPGMCVRRARARARGLCAAGGRLAQERHEPRLRARLCLLARCSM